MNLKSTQLSKIALAMLMSICLSTQAQTSVPTPEPKVIINSEMGAEIFFQILRAELDRFEGKVKEPLLAYLAIARELKSEQLFERATSIAFDARDGDTARVVAHEWARALPQSALANNYLFRINFAQNQFGNGLAPLRDLLRLTPPQERSSIILSLNRYFSQPPDKQAAANELAKILEPYIDPAPTQAAARLTIAKALIEAGRYAAAIAHLQTLTEKVPNSLDGWLLLGNLQLQENQFAAAEKSLLQFLALAPSHNLPADHAGYVQAYLNLAQLAENRKDLEAAQNWLSKIEDNKERLQAQVRRASILAKQGKLAEARLLIQQVPEPTQAQARAKLLAEVQLLREHQQVDTAIALVRKALADEPKDTNLMYELSTLHDKNKNHLEMEQLLRRIMELEPNNQVAYNALGYSLADRGIRLDEAQKLIERALQITPGDPYIVDSLAWVFYRAGKLEEALKTLQSAYKTRADAEIGAHMGEVLWMMNRKDEARQVWRDARTINADNETLVETLKRFDVKL